MPFTNLKVQTTNQPGSYFPFTIPLSAEKLGEILGWNPNGKHVQELLQRLQDGLVHHVTTAKVPRAKGTKHVAFTLTPLP